MVSSLDSGIEMGRLCPAIYDRGGGAMEEDGGGGGGGGRGREKSNGRLVNLKRLFWGWNWLLGELGEYIFLFSKLVSGSSWIVIYSRQSISSRDS